jgi:hypothetical protein
MWRAGSVRYFPRRLDAAGDRSIPSCLLLGWMGSSAYHLMKYVQLWNHDLNANVVAFRSSIRSTGLPFSADGAAHRIARGIADHLNPDQPLFVHCMSNAGWLVFGNMLRLDCDASAGLLRNVKGIVLDSAPSQPTSDIWARGTLSVLLSKPAAEAGEEHAALLRLGHTAASSYLALPVIKNRLRKINQAWACSAPLAPQLYLYSSADKLIPYTHVEAFAAQQQARGVTTHLRKWEDSDHCEHYRWHKEEYTSLIRTFVEQRYDERMQFV